MSSTSEKPVKLKVPRREDTLKKDKKDYSEVEKMIYSMPYFVSECVN